MQQIDNTTPHTASEYDEKVRKTIPFYECFHEETIDLVRTIRPDVRVWLDTGCGTGGLILKAVASFPETLFILADPSEKMLKQARERLQVFPQTHVQVLAPVGTEALVLDGLPSPQVITAVQVHHYLSPESRQNATQCCFDLLESGGVYVTFENIHPNSSQGVEIGLARWKRYQISQGRKKAVVEEHGTRFNTAYFPICIDEHIRILKHCGFSIAEMFWFSHMQAGFYAIK
jgi:tRNA (cmo5U34)-methyltransferase